MALSEFSNLNLAFEQLVFIKKKTKQNKKNTIVKLGF
jgi:hypothetical protein